MATSEWSFKTAVECSAALKAKKVSAVELAQDKDETKDRLERNGIPVPQGKVVYTLKEANKAADEIGRPVVVKPVNGRQGYAVSLEVETAEEMKVAFQAAKEFSSAILIEEMLAGRNYRVVIVGGRMVAASERLLPHVVGEHRRIPESHVFEDIMELVSSVRSGIRSRVTPEHARHVIDIIESGYRSARSGVRQELSTTFDWKVSS